MDDERVGKLANLLYRNHVGIPIDHEHHDPSLFCNLDMIGNIDLENEHDGEDPDKNHEKHGDYETTKKKQ